MALATMCCCKEQNRQNKGYRHFSQNARVQLLSCKKHHTSSVTKDWLRGRNWAILQV